MEPGTLIVTKYPSKPASDGELLFQAGEVLRYMDQSGDWSYGESLMTGRQGWYDPKICTQVCPPLPTSTTGRKDKQRKIMSDILNVEKEYLSQQKTFIDVVVKQLLLRDNSFKRSLMNDPAIAVCINLVQDIQHASEIFLNELQTSKSYREIADCYKRFAPSIQLFAQFASENSNALNVLKLQEKAVSKFLDAHPLPNEVSMEYCFIMPLQHFKKYQVNLESYVNLGDISEVGFLDLVVALSSVIVQTEEVEMRLKDEESNLQLLNIQNQFSGNAAIFKQGRRLVKEGYAERIRMINNQLNSKVYYIHLFNDCLLYSAKKSATIGPPFKLHKSFELISLSCMISEESEYDMKNVISLTSKKDGEVLAAFHFQDEVEMMDWFKTINSLLVAEVASKGKRQQRQSIAAVTSIPGVNPSSLGPRASCVYSFLQAEIPSADSINKMYCILIKPLISSSKGASLVMGTFAEDGDNAEATSDHSQEATKQLTRSQMQQVTEALQQADVQVFLRAGEGLALSLQHFCTSIEAQCKAANWSEQLSIGAIFSSSSANSLYNQYKSYASGQEAFLRLMNKLSVFQSFYKDTEAVLTNGRGKLDERIDFVRGRVDFYLKFIRELSLVTPVGHVDQKPLAQALDNLIKEASEVSEVIKNRKNFDRLLAIQEQFVSVNVFGPDPFIQKLASFDRVHIKEGDLKKVCRKKNKTFKFWLFNDYLVYGEPLGANTYKFNRAIELSKCTIAEHKSNEIKNAFEIFGTEKSFIVIAGSANLQQEWILAISAAIEAIKPAQGTGSISAVAPLWVPDSGSDKCNICQQGFTMFKRRHHCRQCGALVCGEHSSNQMILPHIHDTKKQRVCDTCYHNKDIDVSPQARGVSTDISALKDKAAKSVQSVNLTTTSATTLPESAPRRKWPASFSLRPNSSANDFPDAPPPPVPTAVPPQASVPPITEPPAKPQKLQPGAMSKFQSAAPTPSDISPKRQTELSQSGSVASKLQNFQSKSNSPADVTSPSPAAPINSQNNIQSKLQAYQANAKSVSPKQSPAVSPAVSPATSPQRPRFPQAKKEDSKVEVNATHASITPSKPPVSIAEKFKASAAAQAKERENSVSPLPGNKFNFQSSRSPMPPSSSTDANISTSPVPEVKAKNPFQSARRVSAIAQAAPEKPTADISLESSTIETNKAALSTSAPSVFKRRVIAPPKMETISETTSNDFNTKPTISTAERDVSPTPQNQNSSTLPRPLKSWNPINKSSEIENKGKTPPLQPEAGSSVMPKRQIPPPVPINLPPSPAEATSKSKEIESPSPLKSPSSRFGVEKTPVGQIPTNANSISSPAPSTFQKILPVSGSSDQNMSPTQPASISMPPLPPKSAPPTPTAPPVSVNPPIPPPVPNPRPMPPKVTENVSPAPPPPATVPRPPLPPTPQISKAPPPPPIPAAVPSSPSVSSSSASIEFPPPPQQAAPRPPMSPPSPVAAPAPPARMAVPAPPPPVPPIQPISTHSSSALPPSQPEAPVSITTSKPFTSALESEFTPKDLASSEEAAVDDGLDKYRKMKFMMPEGAVRQRLAIDGFSNDAIEEFMTNNTISSEIKSVMPPDTPVLSKPQISEDPMLAKYRKLRDNLPADAVRQKMKLDGIGDNDIDRFLSGEIIEKLAISRSANPLAGLGSVQLKSAPPPTAKRRVSILDEIQTGAKLKAVQKDDTRMKATPAPGAGGLLDNLAIEMFKRRVNLRQDVDDSDSDDSGFSDSDSDSD